MTSAWEKFNKENDTYAVGQQADLHTKKKGSSKPKATSVTKDNAAMQEQLAAAMIRETEHLKLIRECQRYILHTQPYDAAGSAAQKEVLAKILAVV